MSCWWAVIINVYVPQFCGSCKLQQPQIASNMQHAMRSEATRRQVSLASSKKMLTSLSFHSDFTSVWPDQSGMNWNIMPWALTDQLLWLCRYRYTQTHTSCVCICIFMLNSCIYRHIINCRPSPSHCSLCPQIPDPSDPTGKPDDTNLHKICLSCHIVLVCGLITDATM